MRILLLLVLLLSSINCMGYLTHVAKGQYSIMSGTVPIEDVLEDPELDSEIKEKLEHILEVRSFAVENLGLSMSDSYRRISWLDRDYTAVNVTASKELALEPYTWWFPVVGTVPYLGFFERARAETLAESLQEKGWETRVRDVAAYSTLGWFNDPLMSPQLQYSEWYLTTLIIHESAHATVWFPGDVNFNESFATFVETEGALAFYRERDDAESFRLRLKLLEEREKLYDIYHKTARELDALYNSDVSDEEKRSEKIKIIEEMKNKLLLHGSSFHVLNINAYINRDYNNADFLSFLRYTSGQEFFRQRFENCDESWQCFLEDMRELEKLTVRERKKLLQNE